MAEKERRILMAVDEGEESMHALSWCLKNVISENSKDTLVLLYVKPPRVVYTALDGTGRREHYSKGIFSLNLIGTSGTWEIDGVFCNFRVLFRVFVFVGYFGHYGQVR
jgi:hypothetical protein